MALIDNFILLFTESAPYLLLGLLLAGIIRMLVPDRWITKFLGENSSVVTAAVIGTPLPLCSCSVIPTAIGIRRAGASKASTASFMVATPETGVDSIGVTFALMGP
ncbi:MAG: permease, partial [Oleispira sp.]|nr:permease [Oleispira sp.]